jgi:predicted nucleic acid-binding protein
MKKKLYVETSVWNQLEHNDRPDWKEAATRFMEALKAKQYEVYISAVVIDEIEATQDEDKKRNLLKHVDAVEPTILSFDKEAAVLTQRYMETYFTNSTSRGLYNDCCHVAIATVNGIRHIVSFNCKHLVNDRRIDGFNSINLQDGFDLVVDISTPEKYTFSPME